MMRLSLGLPLPPRHSHHNIYHIIIYLPGCLTYRRMSNSSPVFAFLFFFLLRQLCPHQGKKCADLFSPYISVY